jgi:hypothetical protein
MQGFRGVGLGGWHNSFFRCSRQRISDLPNLDAWCGGLEREGVCV